MRNVLVILMAVVVTAGWSGQAQAGVQTLTLKVDGLACPFCAYGLEKKLKKIDSVEEIRIDMDGGQVTLEMKAGARLTASSVENAKAPEGLVAQVRKAVKEGGFTPRELVAFVVGRVVFEEGAWTLQVSETGETLTLKTDGRADGVKKAATGGPVSLSGVLQTEGTALVLAVERIGSAETPAGE